MTMETIVVRPEQIDKEEVEEPKSVTENKDSVPVCSPNGNNEENTDDDNVSDSEDEAEADYQPEDPECLDEDEDEEEDDGMSDLPVNASLHAADEMKRRLEEIDPCEKLRALCKKGEVEELEDFLARKEETNVDIDYISSDGMILFHQPISSF